MKDLPPNHVICPKCHGRGDVDVIDMYGFKPIWWECPLCNGYGNIEETLEANPSGERKAAE